MNNKILLLDGDGTQSLPIAKSLTKKGHSVYIFCRDKLSYGYGTRYAYSKIHSPSLSDEVSYGAFFKDYVITNSIDVVIPMTDPSAMFLSKNKRSFLQFCNYILPDYQTFITGYDKNKLMSICREYGYPHPKTIDLKATDISTIEDSFFPAFLKPNLTTGARGMKVLYSKTELESAYEKNLQEYGDCHLQELVESGGRQFKAELFLDRNQNLVMSCVIHKQRYYPVTGGSSCFNVTIQNDFIVNICYEVLKRIGWIGFADFDLIEDPKDGLIKIMEINPRIPACIKSAYISGIDYGNMIVDASLGNDLEQYKYIPGKQLRHLGFDILWFIQSKERFKAKPSWFNFFNKDQSFQDLSIDDPLPFIFGTIGNIKRISNADFRKSKQI